MTSSARHRIRRIARPWRIVFVAYAVALTVATHWPALELGTEELPAPDKLLHMLAFGALTVLVRQTRWLPKAWHVIAVLLVWAALDELTQTLPLLQRTFSFQDMVAGQLGVILVAIWWWALAPIGGRGNRTRLAFQSFVVGELFARVRAWVITVGAAGAGALALGVPIGLAGGAFGANLQLLYAAMLAMAFVGAVAGAHTAVAGLFYRSARRLTDEQPCFQCGTTCRDAAFDSAGGGRCPRCGAPIHRGQWALPMGQPLRTVLRGAGPAILVAAGLQIGVILVYGLVLLLSVRLTSAKDVVTVWNSLTPDMQLAVDLSCLGAVLAVATRIYRRRQARLHDRQHERCRICEHDLTGIEVAQGVGRCSECGTPFARFAHE